MDAEPPTVLVWRGGTARYWPRHRAVMWLTSQVPLGLPQRDGYEPSTRELGAITDDGTTPRGVASTRLTEPCTLGLGGVKSTMMTGASDTIGALRAAARKLSGTDEGIACEGTALERVTIRVRKKAFAFLGGGTVMVKLKASLPEAKALAAKEPDRYKAGATGWVTVKLAGKAQLPLLKRWLAESHRLIGGEISERPVRGRSASRGVRRG